MFLATVLSIGLIWPACASDVKNAGGKSDSADVFDVATEVKIKINS